MPDGSRLTVELPDQVTSNLAQIAASMGRSAEALAVEAIADFVWRELELIRSIEEAREDLRNGRVYSTAEVRARAREIIERRRTAREA